MTHFSDDIYNAVWHPYTQMQTAETIRIVKGEGAYLYDEKGEQYIDAISSWWTNLHGHAHPHIAEAIAKQAKQLEHVIFAGFTHKPAEDLAEQLLKRIENHSKVFYSDNGSTAVEVAIKMALQYWRNKGERRNRIIAFRDAYHGDTFGSMSVSARGVFTKPYADLLFEVDFIDTPRLGNEETVLKQFANLVSNEHAAFVFEPLVLGSSGMLMYPPELLDEFRMICWPNGVLSIADEVMTGFGRTGKFLAMDHCMLTPNIVCLSKGITGGFLPFGATTCTQEIYETFLSSDRSKMFFHGHSYTGNPLGCAAALASLEVFEMENTFEKIDFIEKQHSEFAASLTGYSSVIKEVRQRGTILAIELKTANGGGYLDTVRDKAYKHFIEQRVVLRPLGNVIYILPPYCISKQDLAKIYTAITSFLDTLAV